MEASVTSCFRGIYTRIVYLRLSPRSTLLYQKQCEIAQPTRNTLGLDPVPSTRSVYFVFGSLLCAHYLVPPNPLPSMSGCYAFIYVAISKLAFLFIIRAFHLPSHVDSSCDIHRELCLLVFLALSVTRLGAAGMGSAWTAASLVGARNKYRSAASASLDRLLFILDRLFHSSNVVFQSSNTGDEVTPEYIETRLLQPKQWLKGIIKFSSMMQHRCGGGVLDLPPPPLLIGIYR
ncbi:UNVERIFIED_CONTAM: hypothetical protein FKN15_023016 [Acipenser sinensis]